MPGDKVTFKVRCPQCKVNLLTSIPRDGAVAMVPARLKHIPCGATLRVLNPDIKKLFAEMGVDDL